MPEPTTHTAHRNPPPSPLSTARIAPSATRITAAAHQLSLAFSRRGPPPVTFSNTEHHRNWLPVMDRFEEEYGCFSLSNINKSHLEDGNRIIKPASALRRLISTNIYYPLIFEIENISTGRFSHCGVLEFSTEEGFVFLPNWMMKSVELEKGETISLKSASLPRGTYVKIQPHSVKVIALSNPKGVLDTSLTKFTCLTAGDTIMINHDCNQCHINILRTKPSNAISVVETDCEVDFATALDYKDPQKKPKFETNSKMEAADNKPHGEPKETKFRPFTGVSRRLDGQQSSNELAAAVGLISVFSVPHRMKTNLRENLQTC